MIRRKSTKTGWSAVRPFGLLAGAVLAISAAGMPFTASAADPAAVEESDARMSSLVGPIMKEAISLYTKGKFEQALKRCDEANKVFVTTKHHASPQITAQKSMISQLRSDILARWGGKMLLALRQDYEKAKKETNDDKAVALLKKVMADADKIAVKIPAMKAETESLKAAAGKYLTGGSRKYTAVQSAEVAKREGYVKKEVDPLIKSAEEFLKDNLYKKAWEKCTEANNALEKYALGGSPKFLEKKSQVHTLRREIAQKWERAYVMDTRRNYLKAVEMAPKNIKEALSLARSAHDRALEGKNELPVISDDLMEIELACAKLIKSQEFLEATALQNIDVALERRRKDINELLVKGETYYRNKLYSKARDVLEQVYVLDPFNERANVLLGRIYRKINDTAWMRRENEILERINEVEWKWVLPSRPSNEDTLDETPLENDNTSEKATVFKKLQDIIYPGADFEEEPAADVFSLIMRRSRELDPDKKGINITFSDFNEDKFVTLKMGKLPIGELIRYVCMYTGLKYKVDHRGITIGESTLDNMSDQTFTMSNSLYDNITGANSAASKSILEQQNASDNPFEDSGDNKSGGSTASLAASTGTDSAAQGEGGETLKNFFMECGISFPEGATVSYNKRVNKLTVRNTPENLKTMATLLEKIDIATELILVEAKIIEIAVSDLEELGFDWTLTHDNTKPRFLFGNSTQVDSTFGSGETFALGEAVINQVLVRHTGGTGSGANFSTEEAVSALNLIGNLNILPNFGPEGAYNMFLTVHAVDQSARGEVIAAPKVLAKSGNEAMIKMVQEMYFPEEWEDAELEEANNTFEYTPPVPEMGDAEPIGTTFIVKPTVSTNLRTITMELRPTINALTGWTDYDYQFIIGSIRSVDADSDTYAAKMKMPEISERSLVTQLKVYDGDTVVLGGVLQETSAKRDDKYPFLGDVPLVGRLFSNKGSRSTKQNLLIFVTPRLIGYNGVPVNSVSDNGKFDFHR